MTRIDWSTAGKRVYEAGVDRGVLYVDGFPGVPWYGLTSVNESPSGGDSKSFYQDGTKYLTLSALEEFEGTITAYTYPDEFAACDGSEQVRSGLFFTHQRRKPFSFSYRTAIGNDLTESFGYKIHIVYNAMVAPSERANESMKDRTDLNDFSWKFTCTPPAMPGFKPTAHVVIDSRTTDPAIMSIIEDILYGTDEDLARLPTPDEVIAAYDTISTLTITDNGDGTWTATAPYDVIRMLDDETFSITSGTASFIDEDTYTISSE